MDNTDLPENHLLYQEEEKEFQNVIPEFGDCGGGEVNVNNAIAKGESGSSACKSEDTSVSSQATLSKKAQKKAAHI